MMGIAVVTGCLMVHDVTCGLVEMAVTTDVMACLASGVRWAGVLSVKTLPEVIEALRTWVMGILAAVATLFLAIGGLRYMTAAGDPAQVEQAKGSVKAALTGYALAVLAPVILKVLQDILGH
jgi:hypothetical protein